MKKFENVDVIDALQKIMSQNTRFYQSDFRYDVRTLEDAARYRSANKSFLWISRDAGTHCLPVRDVYIEHIQPHNTWIYERDDMSAKAFWVDVFPMKDDQVLGNIYEIDYPELTEHVKQFSVKPTEVEILFRNPNSIRTFNYEDYDKNWVSIHQGYGIVSEIKYLVSNEYYLGDVLFRAKEVCTDAAEASTVDEYVQEMIQEHFHDRGYTADDMAYVIPDDVYNALKYDIPAYALFPGNTKRPITSNQEAQNFSGRLDLLGIRHEDKRFLDYLVERPDLETVGGILSKLEKMDVSLNSSEQVQEQAISLLSDLDLEQ